MTRADILRELGWPQDDVVSDLADRIERVVRLAEAAEREACARVCDEERKFWKRHEGRRDGAESCAAAIRARGEK